MFAKINNAKFIIANLFIEKCIFYDENVDFIIISNNKDNKFETPDYVKTLFRENIGYDFGGWSDALLAGDLYEKYDNFIFVNSSVIGPFIPSYYKNNWTDIYINGLQNNVKLFLGFCLRNQYNPFPYNISTTFVSFMCEKHIYVVK